MSEELDELAVRLKSYEGQTAAVGGVGKDPVNEPMIRHWCEAMGDTNPAYAGPDAIAPPTMLQAWTMGGLSGHADRSDAYDELLGLLDDAGYTSVVATDCEQEYVRPLRPGDEITFDAVIESVSECKTTKLGTGHFVTTRMDVRAGGEVAGTHRFRILKYAPARRKPRTTRPRPVVNRDNAGFWEGVEQHKLLIQRCEGCGSLRFPWLPGCGACGCLEWDTVESSGQGAVYSYVVMHHPPFPAFDPPYAVGLIELAEGVRIVSNVVGVPYDKVRIGMPVRLQFERYDDELVLPVFRAGETDGGGAEMDFTPTEEQQAARDLAARIFGDLATHERLAAAGTGSDAELWNELCAAGLVSAVADIGLLGLVLLLEEQGRTTAQVPFAVSCVYGLLTVAAHGSREQRELLLPAIGDGTVVVSGALSDPGAVREEATGRLSGVVPVVPWLRDATHVLVADDERRLWLVRTAEAGCEPVELTAPWSAGRLTLDGTPGERLGASAGREEPPVGESAGREQAPAGTSAGCEEGSAGTSAGREEGSAGASAGREERSVDAYDDVLALARTAFAGLQAGVCAGSLARAVEHTNTREQFGRPLAAKQGVQLRAADAYMDTEAIRVTTYEAAWRRDEGLAYATHALTAAWWASEAGQRVVHTGQHLHGGTGADLEHPVHRHFLWGRQLDAYLGCGGEVLQELGELIVSGEAQT